MRGREGGRRRRRRRRKKKRVERVEANCTDRNAGSPLRERERERERERAREVRIIACRVGIFFLDSFAHTRLSLSVSVCHEFFVQGIVEFLDVVDVVA